MNKLEKKQSVIKSLIDNGYTIIETDRGDYIRNLLTPHNVSELEREYEIVIENKEIGKYLISF